MTGPTGVAGTTFPIGLVLGAVSTPIGSSREIGTATPVTSVTSVDPLSNSAPSGLSVQAVDGLIEVDASMAATAGSSVLTITGRGCTSSGCGIAFSATLPLTITSIAVLSVTPETFTAPSTDRVSNASDNELQDEVLIVVGSGDTVGTEVEAEAAASDVGGVVVGGLSDAGIYQIRWSTPQDIAQRTAQLDAEPDVIAVTPSTVDLYEQPQDAYSGIVGSIPGGPNLDQSLWTWRYDQVDASGAWAQSTGSSVTVGIVDAGNVFAGHEDLNVTKSLDSIQVPLAHATHVAGIACAKANNDGMVGMAWGCPIVTASAGDISTSQTLQAMYEIAKTAGVRVVNASLGMSPKGGGCASVHVAETIQQDAQKDAPTFRRLFKTVGKNILWTFAAGNNCAPGVASPYAYNSDLPNVLAVAATNSDGSLASFSDYGGRVSVAAPGGVYVPSGTINDVTCGQTTPTTVEGGRCGLMSSTVEGCPAGYCSTYGEDEGTSMAAPMVAGIAADVMAANPSLTAAQAAACITNTAGSSHKTTPPDGMPAGWSTDIPYAGQPPPIVDAHAAVTCATGPTGSTGPTGATGTTGTTGGAGPPSVSAISAGAYDTCVVLTAGRIECWGDGRYGALGDGSNVQSGVPVPVTGISNATQVDVGFGRPCALSSDTSISCWGMSFYYYYANGSLLDWVSGALTPAPVSDVAGASQVASTQDHACAVLTGGSIDCWGSNNAGQLGDGTTTSSLTPVHVHSITNAKQVALGDASYSCALLTTGTVACWGTDDASGQLGNGSTNSTITTPTAVSGISTATQIATGQEHACAVLSTGAVDCWGDNSSGQLGEDPSTRSVSPTPVPVNGIANATQVTTGFKHSCALLTSGEVECWGDNGNAQLGNGTSTPDHSYAPVKVEGLTNVVAIAAGSTHTCAVLATSKIDCWGSDGEGQLGNGIVGLGGYAPEPVVGFGG